MKWSFPKGHKEFGESYLACAMRETLEETGIDLTAYKPVSHQRLSVGEYYFFEVDEIIPEVRDENEIVDARWVYLCDMYRMPCNVDVNHFLSRMKVSRVGWS